MSDPVTPVLGAIASVTSLLKAARTICSWIKDLRHASEFVSDLQVYVEGFTVSIEGVQLALSDPEVESKIASAQTNLVFSKANETLYQIQVTLKKVVQSPGSQVNRSKWVYYQSKCRELKEQLVTHQGSLNAIISAAHSESLRIIAERVHTILHMHDPLLVQFTSQTIAELGGNAELVLSQGSTSTRSSLSEPVKSSGTNATSTQSSISEPLKSSRTNISHDSSPPPIYEEVKANNSNEEEFISNPEKSFSQLTCDSNCRCVCHTTQKVLPNDMGMKHQTSSSCLIVRFVRTCTLRACKKKRRRSQRSFTVPSQVLNKALGVRLLSKGFNHLFFLKSYNTVSENSDQIRYATSGNLQGLMMLVQTNKATINDTGPDGWTLLHSASYRGNLNVVTWLIEMGADTNVAEVGTRKAADLARIRALDRDATLDRRKIADAFKKADFKYDFGFTALHIAVLDAYDKDDKDRPSLLELLQCVEDANNAPAGQNWSEFKKTYRGRSPLFEELIEEFREASVQAKRKRDPRKPYLRLIDEGDERQGWSPFHWAAYTGRLAEMKLLIEHGADPFKFTNQNRNSLHQAAESKRAEILHFVLDLPKYDGQWFDINHRDRWGETPLHVAVGGSFECVKMLLERGAKRDIPDNVRQVPLHDAGLSKGNERYDIIDCLSSDAGEHINAQDEDGHPPIFNVLDTPECVALLLSRGALPSLCDNEGRTAIHHACIEDQAQSLKLLLGACDANLAISFDKNRDTPMAKAFESKSAACIIALLEVDAIGDMDDKDGMPLAHRAAQMDNAEILKSVFDHPTFVKGRKDARERTVEEAATDAGTFKGKVKELILLYESKGMRVDKKRKGRSELAQSQTGPSATGEALYS